MKNWIRRHRILTIIISISLVLVILISVSYFRGAGMVARGINQATATVAGPLSSFANGIKSNVKGLIGFRRTMRENESLQEENAALKREIMRTKLQEKELEELRNLATALNYECVASGSYQYVTAKIIATDNSDYFSAFTIDAGTERGIAKDDVVLSGNGLVGRVSEVGNGYAKVIAVIDDSVNISFQVQRDMDLLGVATGDGKGGISGYMLSDSAGIVEGDILLTTGIGMYPEGIEIGKTTAVNYDSGTQLMTVEVEPSVNFKNLRKVMVLL